MTPTFVKRLAFAVGVIAILGQRIGIPAGGTHVSASVLALLLLFAVLISRGWPVSPPGLALWMCLLVVGAVSTITHAESSVTSLLVMLATYVPLLLLPAHSDRAPGVGHDFFEGVLWATMAGAVLAIVQVLLQWGGRTTLWDPVLTLVPHNIQVTGYNTLYSLQYVDANLGLSFKPNGVVFLEPSFVSMYCALALVWLAHRALGGTRRLRVTWWSGR